MQYSCALSPSICRCVGTGGASCPSQWFPTHTLGHLDSLSIIWLGSDTASVSIVLPKFYCVSLIPWSVRCKAFERPESGKSMTVTESVLRLRLDARPCFRLDTTVDNNSCHTYTIVSSHFADVNPIPLSARWLTGNRPVIKSKTGY